VINTNLPSILYRFRVCSLGKVQNRSIWLTLFDLAAPDRWLPWDDFLKNLPKGQRWPRYQMA